MALAPSHHGSFDYVIRAVHRTDAPWRRAAGADRISPFLVVASVSANPRTPFPADEFRTHDFLTKHGKSRTAFTTVTKTDSWLDTAAWQLPDISASRDALIPTLVHQVRPGLVVTMPLIEAPYFAVHFIGEQFSALKENKDEAVETLVKFVGQEMADEIIKLLATDTPKIAERFGFVEDKEHPGNYGAVNEEFARYPSGGDSNEFGIACLGRYLDVDPVTLNRRIADQWDTTYAMCRRNSPEVEVFEL